MKLTKQREQQIDMSFFDLPEKLQKDLMEIHKLIRDTCYQRIKDHVYDDIEHVGWAKTMLEEFVAEPHKGGPIGDVRVYKNGRKFSCMIQITAHVPNDRRDIDHELFHDFIRNVHQSIKTKVRRKYNMSLACESEHGETFEAFDVWTSAKQAKELWNYFKDRGEKVTTPKPEIHESVLVESVEYVTETSKGYQKVDYRYGINDDNNHRLLLVYSLDGIKVHAIGPYSVKALYRDYQVQCQQQGIKALPPDIWSKPENMQTVFTDIERNIKRTGNTDHCSSNQELLHILDLDDLYIGKDGKQHYKQLDQAMVRPPWFTSKGPKLAKVGEKEPIGQGSFKSTQWNTLHVNDPNRIVGTSSGILSGIYQNEHRGNARGEKDKINKDSRWTGQKNFVDQLYLGSNDAYNAILDNLRDQIQDRSVLTRITKADIQYIYDKYLDIKDSAEAKKKLQDATAGLDSMAESYEADPLWDMYLDEAFKDVLHSAGKVAGKAASSVLSSGKAVGKAAGKVASNAGKAVNHAVHHVSKHPHDKKKQDDDFAGFELIKEPSDEKKPAEEKKASKPIEKPEWMKNLEKPLTAAKSEPKEEPKKWDPSHKVEYHIPKRNVVITRLVSFFRDKLINAIKTEIKHDQDTGTKKKVDHTYCHITGGKYDIPYHMEATDVGMISFKDLPEELQTRLSGLLQQIDSMFHGFAGRDPALSGQIDLHTDPDQCGIQMGEDGGSIVISNPTMGSTLTVAGIDEEGIGSLNSWINRTVRGCKEMASPLGVLSLNPVQGGVSGIVLNLNDVTVDQIEAKLAEDNPVAESMVFVFEYVDLPPFLERLVEKHCNVLDEDTGVTEFTVYSDGHVSGTMVLSEDAHDLYQDDVTKHYLQENGTWLIEFTDEYAKFLFEKMEDISSSMTEFAESVMMEADDVLSVMEQEEDLFGTEVEYMGEGYFMERQWSKKAPKQPLKFAFRRAYDLDTGHLLKIVYDLQTQDTETQDSFQMIYPGHRHADHFGRGYFHPNKELKNYDDEDKEFLNQVKQDAPESGNTDMKSSGHRVLAIVDLATGQRLSGKWVNVIGEFNANIGDNHPLALSPEQLKTAIYNPQYGYGASGMRLKEGMIDHSATFKSTKWFSDIKQYPSEELKDSKANIRRALDKMKTNTDSPENMRRKIVDRGIKMPEWLQLNNKESVEQFEDLIHEIIDGKKYDDKNEYGWSKDDVNWIRSEILNSAVWRQYRLGQVRAAIADHKKKFPNRKAGDGMITVDNGNVRNMTFENQTHGRGAWLNDINWNRSFRRNGRTYLMFYHPSKKDIQKNPSWYTPEIGGYYDPDTREYYPTEAEKKYGYKGPDAEKAPKRKGPRQNPHKKPDVKKEDADLIFDPYEDSLMEAAEEDGRPMDLSGDMSPVEAKRTLAAISKQIINDPKKKVTQYTGNLYANIITKNLLKAWGSSYRKLKITVDDYQTFHYVEFKIPKMSLDFVSRYIEGRESLSGFLHRSPEIRMKVSPRIFHTMKDPNDAYAFFMAAVRYYEKGAEKFSRQIVADIMKSPRELKHLMSTTKLSGLLTTPMGMLFQFDNVDMAERKTFQIKKDEIDAVRSFIRGIYTKYASPADEKNQILKDMTELVKSFQEAVSYNREEVQEWSRFSEALTELYHDHYKDQILCLREAWQEEQIDLDWLKENRQNGMFAEKLFVKRLKKIPRDLVAYITIEGETIKDANDKMMIASYCLSKVEIVEWYIELIDAGDSRYIVPHDKKYLESLRTQLLAAYQKIMATPIPEKKEPFTIDIRYPGKG